VGNSDVIQVTLTRGRGGNWSGKCEDDNHREMGRTSEMVLLKMREHFKKKHPDKKPYVKL
jgi:hypothetical protein